MTERGAASPAERIAKRPELSVVMPVYNALPYLDEAVQSILGQTYSSFEFVVYDDGSTDGSTARLREWAARDTRIRLIEGKRNLGPALSSDLVAREARAPIVARMDADDIACPDRLAEQITLLQNHPEVGLVASLSDIVDGQGRKIRGPEPWRLARRSVFVPFAHGAIMYRQPIYEAVGGYRKECEFWEDQDLIVRMSAVSRIMVIPRLLYRVRQSSTSTRVGSAQERLEKAVDLMYRSIARLENNESYDALLREHGSIDVKVDSRVFISLGSVLLWAGGKPRLFRRLLRHGNIRMNARTATALVWTAWASASPSSLRMFLRLLLIGRNAVRYVSLPDHAVYWAPATSPAALSLEREGAA